MLVDERKICSDPTARTQRPHADACRGGLEACQERVDVDVGQFLRLVGLVWRANGVR